MIAGRILRRVASQGGHDLGAGTDPSNKTDQNAQGKTPTASRASLLAKMERTLANYRYRVNSRIRASTTTSKSAKPPLEATEAAGGTGTNTAR